ncbi:hypothetical protein FACS1894158_06180 [Betaproteobacteria bacterium]|nr:hypothetical protein FACS1894158_06180 [Betaproteobacteria bacterium]
MFPSRSFVFARPLLAVPLLVASGLPFALAADETAEHERLAAMVRQLDLIDRLAEHAATVSPQDPTRYHFDYERLREDVGRVRAGLQDYLVPLRAQPRDPVELRGDYRQSAPSGMKTP